MFMPPLDLMKYLLLHSEASLFLYGNELTGTIPSEIDMLTKLGELCIGVFSVALWFNPF